KLTKIQLVQRRIKIKRAGIRTESKRGMFINPDRSDRMKQVDIALRKRVRGESAQMQAILKILQGVINTAWAAGFAAFNGNCWASSRKSSCLGTRWLL